MIRAVFAPDWRNGVPYQRLLADALSQCDVQVDYLSEYRRGFPLWRGLRRRQCDLLHLHWPEAYYTSPQRWRDWIRRVRFGFDLAVATARLPLVVTAHNLYPHNIRTAPLARINAAIPFQRARAVIAHSEAAKSALVEEFQIKPERCRVIPHGDLAVPMGQPIARDEARGRLGLGPNKLCLMFGAIEPYKGYEEILDFWAAEKPDADLAIVGKPITEPYGMDLLRHAGGNPRVIFRPGWLPDEQLSWWLSATDCVLFNYQHIFTSGAACLSRSWGVPIVIPARLATVDLDEPSPVVFRFDASDLRSKLEQALNTPAAYKAAATWREKCRWDRVARQTADVYRDLVSPNRKSQPGLSFGT